MDRGGAWQRRNCGAAIVRCQPEREPEPDTTGHGNSVMNLRSLLAFLLAFVESWISAGLSEYASHCHRMWLGEKICLNVPKQAYAYSCLQYTRKETAGGDPLFTRFQNSGMRLDICSTPLWRQTFHTGLRKLQAVISSYDLKLLCISADPEGQLLGWHRLEPFLAA